jgi:hypothetical protein
MFHDFNVDYFSKMFDRTALLTGAVNMKNKFLKMDSSKHIDLRIQGERTLFGMISNSLMLF